MNNRYGGVIWTNHAMDRMRERGIKQGDAWATFNRPGKSRKGASGNWVYLRNWGGEQIEVVAKQDQKREWIILSVWSRHVESVKNSKTSFWRLLYNLIFK